MTTPCPTSSLPRHPPDRGHHRPGRPTDLIFTLFSSGASSLCVLPPDAYALDDVRTVYRLAIKYGDMSVIWRVSRYFFLVNSVAVLLRAPAARTVNLLMSFKPYLPWAENTSPKRRAGSRPGRRGRAGCRRLFGRSARPRGGASSPPGCGAAFERLDPGCKVPDLDGFESSGAASGDPSTIASCSTQRPIRPRLSACGPPSSVTRGRSEPDAAEMMVGLAPSAPRAARPSRRRSR